MDLLKRRRNRKIRYEEFQKILKSDMSWSEVKAAYSELVEKYPVR